MPALSPAVPLALKIGGCAAENDGNPDTVVWRLAIAVPVFIAVSLILFISLFIVEILASVPPAPYVAFQRTVEVVCKVEMAFCI